MFSPEPERSKLTSAVPLQPKSELVKVARPCQRPLRSSPGDEGAGGVSASVEIGQAQMCLRVAPDRLIEVLDFLADDPRTQFDQLSDLTCVDYLEFPEARDRFGVIYNLVSTSLNHRLFVKSFVNDPNPQLPSVTDVWRGAEWLERVRIEPKPTPRERAAALLDEHAPGA